MYIYIYTHDEEFFCLISLVRDRAAALEAQMAPWNTLACVRIDKIVNGPKMTSNRFF